MPRQRFLIYCTFGCHEFTLKEEGSQEEKVFRSIMDAITFARHEKAPEGARIAVVSPFGGVMMETLL